MFCISWHEWGGCEEGQVHRWQGGMLSFESRTRDKVMENNDWAVQLAFFIAVSIAGGLLGAAFNGLRR